MSDPIRLGLVGCGRLAELGYVPALAGLTELTVVAVADPDPGRRAVVGGALGTNPVEAATAAELLGAVELDGVLIASPVRAHVDDARAAAAARVVALVEKPPAPDRAGAAELLALRPTPHLGFNRRYDEGARAARDAARPLPDPALRLRLHYRRTGWAPHQVRDDALLDLGPHLVDWARWITGQEVVGARAAVLMADRATVELTLERGTATIEVAADRTHEELIEVRAGGRLVHRHRIGGALAGVLGRLRGGRPDALVTTLRAELAAYARALRTGEGGDLGTPADGVAAMAALDAARRSAADGGAPVPVTPQEP